MSNKTTKVSCPDPDCQEGWILVYNIYNPDPFKGEKQLCDSCQGEGFLYLDSRKVN